METLEWVKAWQDDRLRDARQAIEAMRAMGKEPLIITMDELEAMLYVVKSDHNI